MTILSERDLARISERLTDDFDGQVPFDTAVAVLRRYVDRHATATPEQVEQAVRIQLQLRRQGNPHDLA